MFKNMMASLKRSFTAKPEKIPPLDVVFPAVEHWFQTETGQSLLCAEQYLIKRSLSGCFGYHLLQMSVSRQKFLCHTARVQHKFCVYPIAARSLEHKVDVVSDVQHLPLATNSVDAVLLHHCHEFVENPQQLLREIERVLVNGGHLVVVGFNPYSLMALQGIIAKFLPHSIWHNQSFSHHRLEDWLSLLGFQVTQCQFGYRRYAGDRLKSQSWLWQWFNRLFSALKKKLPLGSFYCITAVKQEVAMTPDINRWRVTSPGFTAIRPRANIRQSKVVPFKKT